MKMKHTSRLPSFGSTKRGLPARFTSGMAGSKGNHIRCQNADVNQRIPKGMAAARPGGVG